MAVKKKAKAKSKATKKKAVSKVANVKAIKDPMSKSAMYAHIADATELSKKDVSAVFDEYASLIERHIKKNAAGEFKMPGLFKVKVVRKPAKRARKGINPFTGEEMMFKAKPARNVVKVQPLKGLKDMVA